MTAPGLTWPALARPCCPCRSKRAARAQPDALWHSWAQPGGHSWAQPGGHSHERKRFARATESSSGPGRELAGELRKQSRRKKGRHPHSDAGLFCSGQAAPKRDGLSAQIRLLPDPLPEDVSALISLFRLHRSSLRTRCCVHSPQWSDRRRTCPWKQS